MCSGNEPDEGGGGVLETEGVTNCHFCPAPLSHTPTPLAQTCTLVLLVVPQPATSSANESAELISVYVPSLFKLIDHFWPAPPSQTPTPLAQTSTLVPLAVPQPDTSNTRPLAGLISV